MLPKYRTLIAVGVGLAALIAGPFICSDAQIASYTTGVCAIITSLAAKSAVEHATKK